MVAVREGDAAPGLFDPLGSGDELYGNSLNSAHVLPDGTVGYRADQIQNIDTDFESALYQGSTVKAQEGTQIGESAGIDVYDVEPLPRDHPLRGLDNTVLTGHTAYVMRETYTLAYGEAVEDIQAWLKGEPLRVLNDG